MNFQSWKFGRPQFSTVFKSQIRYFLSKAHPFYGCIWNICETNTTMWTMRTIPVLKSGHHPSKNLDVVSGFQNGTIPYVVAVLKHGTTSMVSARVIK